MRNKILRRKDFILAAKLKKKYPGMYKLFSDAGYGDCSIVEYELTIIKAIRLMGSMIGYKTKSISTIMGIDHNPSRFNEDCLEQANYRIVEDDRVMPCEEEGFDWMDS